MRELEHKEWFFLGGDLYKKLSANRAKNQLKAYNYAEQRPKMLILSEAKRYRESAFDVADVCRMLNRAQRTIYYYIDGDFGFTPSGKSDMPDTTTGKWWFTAQDVLDLRDIIFENSQNSYAPRHLPTREEVRAMTRTKSMIYVMEDGEFVPIFKAEVW